jgi:predicted PurR-regulated permease PerM
MLGFANLIPFFGAIVGTIAAIIVIIVTDGLTIGIISGIVMLVIQQFDANFIFPRLIGGSMKISPLLVIIGITVGNAYAGVIGMIIAIPIVTVLRNIIDDILVYIEHRKTLRNPNENGEV